MSAGSAVTPSHFRGWIASNALPIAILAIVIVFSAAQPAFISPDNLIGIVQQVALVGIMATCTTFVIMTGGVDLSVGPVLAAAGLVSYYSLEAGLPLALVILAGLSIGALVGLANGAAIAFLELPPIIVTLAMLSIARGSALILGGPEQHLIRDQPEYTFHRRRQSLRPARPGLHLRARGARHDLRPAAHAARSAGRRDRRQRTRRLSKRTSHPWDQDARLRHFWSRRGAGRNHPVVPGAYGAGDLWAFWHGARRHRRRCAGRNQHHGRERLDTRALCSACSSSASSTTA